MHTHERTQNTHINKIKVNFKKSWPMAKSAGEAGSLSLPFLPKVKGTRLSQPLPCLAYDRYKQGESSEAPLMSPASLFHRQETSHLKTQAWNDVRGRPVQTLPTMLLSVKVQMVETHFCPHGISLEVHPGDRCARNSLSALSWLSSVCRSVSAQSRLTCFSNVTINPQFARDNHK